MNSAIIHQSLHRPDLVMGGEREPALLSALLAMLTALSGMSITSLGLALVIWLGSQIVWQRMAKKDPLLCRVWMRQIAQQSFYPAKSSPWANPTKHVR